MYQKILVPLDGSRFAEQVLPFACRLAEAFDASIELLRANDPAARPPFWPPEKDYLKDIAERHVAGRCPVTTIEVEGEPAPTIVDRARANPACMIAMATHGTSGIRRWLIGSVAAKVAQRAANPLFLIRPEGVSRVAATDFETIFVPLDGSALGEIILPHAIAAARAMKLKLHLLRVYTVLVQVADEGFPQGSAAVRDSLRAEASAYLERKLEELRAAGLSNVLGTDLEGDPAGEIIDIARKTPHHLIAMSTHGRSGIGRWLLGSVAERVLHHHNGPVLLVRAR
jgi:nucleotide-binding universal stress UspA family protein